jgi:membrane protease YdiL (CAAX protease family)
VKLNKRSMLLMSLFTLLGMGGVGLASILWLQKIPLLSFLHSGAPIAVQLFYGLTYGLGAGLMAIVIMKEDIFDDTSAVFTDMIGELNPNIFEICFYSFCAGVGEELLFRGGLQPFAGIWITSVIFIALHGYLNITDPMMMIYGLFMVAVSAGMGYLLVSDGIYASMSAHFVYDVLMFLYLKGSINTGAESEDDFME